MTTLSSLLSQTYSGFSGFSGSGVSGWSGRSGYSGYSGISGSSGYSGSGVSGWSGARGSVNVENDIVTTLLYPLLGTGAANNVTEFKISSNTLTYNANTGHLYLKNTLGVGAPATTNSLYKFEVSGNTGQLFSVVDSLSGIIFSVNDISGIPSIEVNDAGTINIGTFGGNVFIGTNTTNTTISSNVVVGSNVVINTAGYWVGPDTGGKVNVTDDSSSELLYPVMSTTTGNGISDFRASTSKIYFNANTGTIFATAKSFRIPHPTKKNKTLTYGSLEGPENGVYYRGLSERKIISLPSYWSKLIDENSITVNLTSTEFYQELYVEKIENNKVYVKNNLSNQVKFYFTVYAERIDIDKLEVE